MKTSVVSAFVCLKLTAPIFADESFFESRIRPVLIEHCYSCHSEEAGKAKGGLQLDTRMGIRLGGDTGPAIVPGDLEKSLLIAAVRWHDDDTGMPPEKKGGKLPAKIIADFEKWVREGAVDPRGGGGTSKSYDGEAAKDWWAYQAIKKPVIPETKDKDWPQGPIDQFILAKLEEKGLKPVGEADDATIIRRVYLDLVGLPPTPGASTEQVLDRLLGSRQFAERWARHWLDVARYAESSGGDVNVTLPEAWRYRDYVIESFQEDNPFNEFIREQIAGDLLPATNEKERAQNLIATGFLAVGQKSLNNSDPKQFAVDLADEQIDAVSQAFLGVTVSCARCHDHKFDPISQRDYTALSGIFLSTQTHYGTAGGVRGRNASSLIEVADEAGLATVDRSMDARIWEQKKARLDQLVKQRDEVLASRRPGGRSTGGTSMTGFEVVRIITQAKRLEMELSAFRSDGSLKPQVMGVVDKPVTAPRAGGRNPMRGGPNSSRRNGSGFEIIGDSPLFIRGDIDQEAEHVPRGLPEFLAHGATLDIREGTSGRLELADWIASPSNTLTARVIVNRVWHWIFGQGLVRTVDNFGASGELASHPELLDYLAYEFMDDGWSLKRLIKRIMLSRVYRLDSAHDEGNYSLDPDNRFLWRRKARRLDAEVVRDSMLSVGGLLKDDPRLGSLIALAGDGPIGGDRFQILKESEIESANGHFRSVYLPVARTVETEVLAVFDLANPSLVQGARETTIVPRQALYLMNSPFVEEAAEAMARRVMKERGFQKRFDLACRLAFGRGPFSAESAAARRLAGDDLEAWTGICRALFSSGDFLFNN